MADGLAQRAAADTDLCGPGWVTSGRLTGCAGWIAVEGANLCLSSMPDGRGIWSSPAGHNLPRHPGSALLFPGPCVPTGDLASPTERCADRTAMTRKRRRTRARYIAGQRRHNRQARQARQLASFGPAAPDDDEPPPF